MALDLSSILEKGLTKKKAKFEHELQARNWAQLNSAYDNN